MPLQALFASVHKADLTALGWLTAFDENTPLCCPSGLSGEEKTFAESFFSGLGITDLDGQLRHIEWHLQKAQDEVLAADEQCVQRTKAYTTTGICVGLCVGFLLW